MSRAVVLGAGFAGLLAARALSDVFTEVTIVERDPAAATSARRGVPQGRHLHGLLDGGRQIIEELHPGFTGELIANGAPTAEPLRETSWYFYGQRLAVTPTGLRSVMASRPFLESALRARTAALPGVRFAPAAAAVGLVASAGGPITGVRVKAASGEEQIVPADLTVDASGRGSRVPAWLERVGQPAPREDRVDVNLGYATRIYRRLPAHLGGRLSVIISTVPRSRGGACQAIEDGRWLVTLAGMLGDHPPTDPDEFTAFAATLAATDIYDVIRDAEPLSEAVPYRFRGSRWLRFDLLRNPPPGLVVLGDATCSVNPLYAQGMTLAAQQVRVLRDAVGSGGSLDPSAYYGAVAPFCRAAWEIATRADLALPEVDGRRGLTTRALGAYVSRVQRVAHRDPAVARAFIRVANLTDPPGALLTPRVLSRVLRPGAAQPAAVPAGPAVPAGQPVG